MLLNKLQLMEHRVAVAHLHGRLDRKTAPDAQELVRGIVKDGHIYIVLDMGGVDAIDSSGLCALVMGLKIARRSHGDLRLASLPVQARTVLEITRLDRVLAIHESLDEALGALTGR